MFSNTTIALSIAVVLGTAPAALAETASKHVRHIPSAAAMARAMVPSNQVRHSSDPAFDVYATRRPSLPLRLISRQLCVHAGDIHRIANGALPNIFDNFSTLSIFAGCNRARYDLGCDCR